jgi:5'-nucleotidase
VTGVRVLVTNDDGTESPAIVALARAVRPLADEVVVAAPQRNVSGAGTSLLGLVDGGRLPVEKREDAELVGIPLQGLEAHPALIVLLARHGAFGEPPDLVLSGINAGPNTGQAVLHSGTVGAAMTAASLGMSAAAVSAAGTALPTQSELDALVGHVTRLALDHRGCVVNVNVPAQLPWRELRWARLAKSGAVEVKAALTGSTLQVAVSPLDDRSDAESDSALLGDGYATITLIEPLAVRTLQDECSGDSART